MNKATKLKNLHKKWTKECKCTLRHSATRAVIGHGDPHTKIVFIGEAPGKTEDKLGYAFAGSAGRFLDQMLEVIGLKRKDTYITNLVKYRPPNNRDPLPKEKESCREWLLEEIKVIEPKLIIFLGRHAMNNFFPELKISKAHGKLLIREIKYIKTRYFFPLYHPAVALYNGSMRETLKKDFKKIPKILRGIEGREKK